MKNMKEDHRDIGYSSNWVREMQHIGGSLRTCNVVCDISR